MSSCSTFQYHTSHVITVSSQPSLHVHVISTTCHVITVSSQPSLHVHVISTTCHVITVSSQPSLHVHVISTTCHVITVSSQPSLHVHVISTTCHMPSQCPPNPPLPTCTCHQYYVHVTYVSLKLRTCHNLCYNHSHYSHGSTLY